MRPGGERVSISSCGAAVFILLRDPGLDYECRHCPREIDRQLCMPRSCPYRLATLAVRITNLTTKGAKALDHTCTAPENSLESILRVLTRRDVKPLCRCLV
jgi:hypothetical protein